MLQSKDEEILDLQEKLAKEQQRLLDLEKYISDLKEDLMTAEDRIRKLTKDKEALQAKQHDFIVSLDELREKLQERDDTIDTLK